jgi:hypothetical protein
MTDDAINLQKQLLRLESPLWHEVCAADVFLDPEAHLSPQLSKKTENCLTDYMDLKRDDWTPLTHALCKHLPKPMARWFFGDSKVIHVVLY